MTPLVIPTTSPPPSAPRPRGAWRLRRLAARAREAQLSGHVLIGTGLALTVLACATLAWSGIVSGVPRFLLLLLSAALLPTRLLSSRLSAMIPADGIAAPPASGGLRRWLSIWQSAAVLLAAGLNSFGSHSRLGPAIAAAAAVLLLLLGLRRMTANAFRQPQPHPTSVLALACVVAAVEPLWGWRGQSVVIGLCVIAAALAVELLRPPTAGQRPAAAQGGG